MWNKLPEALTGGEAQDAVGRAFQNTQIAWAFVYGLLFVQVFIMLVIFPLILPMIVLSSILSVISWGIILAEGIGLPIVFIRSNLRQPAQALIKDRQQRLAAIEEFAEEEHRRLEAEYEAAIQELAPPKPLSRGIVISIEGPRYADSGLPYQAEPARDYYAALVKLLQLRPLGGEAREFALDGLHLTNTPAGRALAFWVHAMWLAECSSKHFRGWAVPEATEVLQRYLLTITNADAPYPTVLNRTVSLLQKSGACPLHPDAEMGERVAWLVQKPEQTALYQQHYVEWCLLAEQNNWDPPCVADLYYLMCPEGNGYWGLDRPLEKRGYFPGTGHMDPEHSSWQPNKHPVIFSAY